MSRRRCNIDESKKGANRGAKSGFESTNSSPAGVRESRCGGAYGGVSLQDSQTYHGLQRELEGQDSYPLIEVSRNLKVER